jgi:hypothetical protein
MKTKSLIYIFLILTSLFLVIGQVNASPAVDSVYISDSANSQTDDYHDIAITPIAGGTKILHINGLVSDTDGEVMIGNTSLVFYRSGLTDTYNCGADNNNCYRVSTCDLSSNNETTKKYDCPISLEYYTDATDAGGRFPGDNWVAYVKTINASSSEAINNSTTKEVATVLSLDISGVINYGGLSLGDVTTADNNYELVIAQKGNSLADVEVSGADMTCDIGSIPVGNQKWSLSDVSYNSGSTVALSTTPTRTNLNMGYRDDDGTALTKALFWNISIPATGIKGSCSGSNTITAISTQ